MAKRVAPSHLTEEQALLYLQLLEQAESGGEDPYAPFVVKEEMDPVVLRSLVQIGAASVENRSGDVVVQLMNYGQMSSGSSSSDIRVAAQEHPFAGR